MRIMCARDKGKTRAKLSPEELPALLEDKSTLLWIDIDVDGESSTDAEWVLSQVFHFHPLAVDDAINEVHLPKIDDWQDYLYLVVRGITFEDATRPILLPELDIFLGDHYLVTFHYESISSLERLWDVVDRDERLMENGPAYLLYRILDELVEDYIKTLEQMEDIVERVESQLFVRPRPAAQQQILDFKHSVLKVRRVVSLQREVLNRLARDPLKVVNDEERIYFRDVYDHMIRLYDLSDSLRDVVTGALELYLSAINNRMNEIMKTLTVITTLFMPLTFITGFFGMNFFGPVLPSLNMWTRMASFLFTLLLMAGVPIVMFLWMRKRAWM